MLSLIGRLREPIFKERKLDLTGLLQNVSSQYILYSRASRPRSVDEIRIIGRELEREVTCIEEYKGSRPLAFRNTLEMDLVYDPRKSMADVYEVQESESAKIRWFNCGKTHYLEDCAEPTVSEYYGCGKHGVIRPECDCYKTGFKKRRRELQIERLSVPVVDSKTSSVPCEEVASVITNSGKDRRLYFSVRLAKVRFQGLYDSREVCSVVERKGWNRLKNQVIRLSLWQAEEGARLRVQFRFRLRSMEFGWK